MNLRRLLLIALFGLLALSLGTLAVALLLSRFLVDVWWYCGLGYCGYFWLKLLYPYLLGASITLFFFLLFFANFWFAAHVMGYRGRTARERTLWERFQTAAMEVYAPLSLIFAVILAIPFYRDWRRALLFLFGRRSGVDDPAYGVDISFYLFQFPFFKILQVDLFLIFLMLLLAVAALYWYEFSVLPVQRRPFPKAAKVHLTLLALLVGVIGDFWFLLERFSLLYLESHEPIFFGPGFVEMVYHLPLIWVSLAAFSILVLGLIYFAYRRRRLWIPVVSFAVLLLSIALRHIDLVPIFLEEYFVKANPVRLDGKYMDRNIRATLHAYGLHHVHEVTFRVEREPTRDLEPRAAVQYIHNIPVWDEDYLWEVYQQLQGLRPYYRFSNVDVDRYTFFGEVSQVNLAAREVYPKLLGPDSQTWENLHLRYTHGYGAVMTPAAQEGDRPMVWFLRDLELFSPVGISVKHPEIYYGENREQEYLIIPNTLEIAEIAGHEAPRKNGILIKSLFRKLIAAVAFRDPKIFFSIAITEESRLRFRRNILERVRELVPFLLYDSDPYLVAGRDQFYWIIDAYTYSSWYPYSKPQEISTHGQFEQKLRINYLRNSVKVVVSAYDGSVDFYIADPSDPIIQAYRRAFPGLFRDIRAMPLELQRHLRYPRDYFQIQMAIYARYHQRNPALFYQNSERWSFPQVEHTPRRPYYLTVKLVEERHPQIQPFFQLAPMTPINRDNLAAVAIGGVRDLTEGPYVPELIVYEFPKDIQVDGPAQVLALINQDPDISAAFTLWNQMGSEVKLGRIIVLPVGRTMLYVQPVYLVSATHARIPQLTRVILSAGGEVVMARTLEEGIFQLWQKLMGEQGR